MRSVLGLAVARSRCSVRTRSRVTEMIWLWCAWTLCCDSKVAVFSTDGRRSAHRSSAHPLLPPHIQTDHTETYMAGALATLQLLSTPPRACALFLSTPTHHADSNLPCAHARAAHARSTRHRTLPQFAHHARTPSISSPKYTTHPAHDVGSHPLTQR